MGSWTVYLVAFIVSLISYLYTRRKKRKLSPGPWAWPILGNALELNPFFHHATYKYAKKYGDIASFFVGMDRVILLSDPKLVLEAFNDPALSGRPDSKIFLLTSDGPHGVINSEGQEWVEQRRFTLRHLRYFGFGKNTGEELITSELKEFIQELEKNVGQTISMNRSFGVAVLNTLWTILSGARYEQDDPCKRLEQRLSKAPLVFLFPKFSQGFPKLTGFDFIEQVFLKIRAMGLDLVNKHKEEINYDDQPKDFIEAYLKEIKATTEFTSSFYGSAGSKLVVQKKEKNC